MVTNTSQNHGYSVLSYAVNQSRHQPVVVTISAPSRRTRLACAIAQVNAQKGSLHE